MIETKEQVLHTDYKTGLEILALGSPTIEIVNFIAQGDCIVKKCGTSGVFTKEFSSIPKNATPTGSNLVLKGQQNNHAIYYGEFEVLEKDGVTFLRVDAPCILDHVRDLKTQTHAEHHAMWIPPGEYFIDQLNEYDHLAEESRKLID